MPGSFFAGVSRRRDSESLGGGEKYRMNHLSVCWLRLRPFTCVRVRPSCEPRRRRCSAKRETHIVPSSSSQLTRVSYEQTSAILREIAFFTRPFVRLFSSTAPAVSPAKFEFLARFPPLVQSIRRSIETESSKCERLDLVQRYPTSV